MKTMTKIVVGAIAALVLMPNVARAEILAMLNYESKTEDSLKALQIQGAARERREGIAVMDIDPSSENFGKILMDIPLPPDLVAHHLFYNRDASKIYMTSLAQPALHVIDMKKFPWRLKRLETPGCVMQEDVIFSEDNKTWYLTCMGSDNIFVGDAVNDTVTKSIDMPDPYPHGIAINSAINRILVTSTVAPDLSTMGETIVVLEADSGKVLSSIKVSNKASPSGEAPVELLFVPGANPPVAYATNMFGGTLWALKWDDAKKDFDAVQAYNFADVGGGVPLEIYFNKAVDRLYVTTANPGMFHIFDVTDDPTQPKLLKTLPAAGGAHHVVIDKAETMAWVQNSLINLPGMSDGSITVIDLVKGEVVGSIDTLKDAGFNPNMIVMLPEWHHPMGH
jgi:DNA-binding beta-propeller fold protein YncE